ncbi:MAG: NUDIX domain-containing protein [Rhodoplanes sp.]|uniref:NUDIX hydrolase n=1 Tax=Rhodoplanes sp. TaxID=1968906 RepID=UPI0018210D41|nr:NUDIX domain-containing protein [Rhodoplanes sp.]NVO12526.1 NUDIX domain-containing protein [Rhodoplanes sp.]
MARTHVLAAGGIVVRHGSKPLVAIVQRRKDNGWVLPKGKLKPLEDPITGALREVMEETGHDVAVHEFLGVIAYPVRGSVKLAQFWRMQALDGTVNDPARDIRAVDWLPLSEAVARLSVPHEQVFLGGVGPAALASVRAQQRAKRAAVREPVRAAGRITSAEPPAIVRATAADLPPANSQPSVPSPGLLRRIVQGWTSPRHP